MQIVRTIIWVLILVGVLVFSFFNWREVEVTIWDNLVLETKVPALVIISFLLGFLPVWLYSRGVIWSLNRKIRSLEIAAKASSVSAAARESDREELARQDIVADEPAPIINEHAEDAPAEDAPAKNASDTAVDEPVPEEQTRLTADLEPPADDTNDDNSVDEASVSTKERDHSDRATAQDKLTPP